MSGARNKAFAKINRIATAFLPLRSVLVQRRTNHIADDV